MILNGDKYDDQDHIEFLWDDPNSQSLRWPAELARSEIHHHHHHHQGCNTRLAAINATLAARNTVTPGSRLALMMARGSAAWSSSSTGGLLFLQKNGRKRTKMGGEGLVFG